MIIVILLVIIACCLLFGKDATANGLGSIFAILFILLFAFLIFASCMSAFD